MSDEVKDMIDAIKGNIACAPTTVLMCLEHQLVEEGSRLTAKLSRTHGGHWLDAAHYARVSHTAMALGMVYQALAQAAMRGLTASVDEASDAATHEASIAIFQSVLRLTGHEGRTVRLISSANRETRLETGPDAVYSNEDMDFIFEVN